MTEKVKRLLQNLRTEEHKKGRTDLPVDITARIKGKERKDFPLQILLGVLDEEVPRIFEHDRFGFNRYHGKVPFVFYDESGKVLDYGRWRNGNTTPDMASVMKRGFADVLLEIEELEKGAGEEAKKFYADVKTSLRAAADFAEVYRKEAKRVGCADLYTALTQIPMYPARNFYEACVFIKFIHFTLRCADIEHIGIGRFDQYMLPYFEADLKDGKTEEELLETLEEFFISLNYDSDIYGNVQAGDNGQTLMLGGYDKDGTDRFNRLSELCLKASTELCLIEPKINIRVNSTTPMERFELCTELTKKGLGFPQYSNDDVVIPGLIELGYGDDSYDYVTAACWEFIIPGKGKEIVNIGQIPFAVAVERAVLGHLADCENFEDIWPFVDAEVEAKFKEIDDYNNEKNNHEPSPYMSVFVGDCIKRGKDFSLGGAVYNNFGLHGHSISVGADCLAALKKAVFEEKVCTAEELISAMKADFVGFEELQKYLKACPKMGTDDDYVDSIAVHMLERAAKQINGRPNCRGGIYRLGTGTANGYIGHWTGALPNGDNDKDGYGVNYSPAITTKFESPTDVIKSFTKPDLKKLVNGGPLTLELHDSTFASEEAIGKVAALVKTFVDLGGHQLQLNSINRETLLDAKIHPENHKGLIVRVWGWSGYFVELSEIYQNHIIRRTEYKI